MPRAKKPKPPVESHRLPQTFDQAALLAAMKARPRPTGLGQWTEISVASAVDAQISGKFKQAVLLARSILKEPTIYAACSNRLAPHRGLRREITCKAKLTGTPKAILDEAKAVFENPASVALSTGVLADDFDRLAIHGIAINQVYWVPRSDGSRLDPFVEAWPLEFVQWFEIAPDGGERGLFADTADGWVRIVHGDGRWIVSALHADQPWRRGGLVALGDLWIDLRYGRRDRSRSAESHGDDKWWAELPPNIMPEDENGRVMLEQLGAMYEPRHAAIFANGTKVNRSEAMSQNWQIFKELLESDLKDASRVMLGQDGTMTNTGGNYIKAWGLFGVRDDYVEGDFSAENAAINTGLLRPWSKVNFGRWDHLEHAWVMPDADEDARVESVVTRRKAFWEDVASARKSGVVVDQTYLDELAAEYRVRAPTLAATNDVAPATAPASSETIPIVAHRTPLRAASSG